MDALVIWQPWASLVMAGWKPYEFRKWDFTTRGRADLVGKRIVICAGARPIKAGEVLDLIQRIEQKDSSVQAAALPLLRRVFEAHKCQGVLELSCGLGTATIGRPRSTLGTFSAPDSDRLRHHMFGWPMIDPKPFPEPIPCKGLQGFFTFPAAVPAGF